jgi:hypothetical protein
MKRPNPPGRWAAHSAEARAGVALSATPVPPGYPVSDPSTLRDWLTPEAFLQKVQPMLGNVRTSAIATALGVSWVYASHIRAGGKNFCFPKSSAACW